MVTVLYYVVCGWVWMWTSASLVTGMDPQTRLQITNRIRKLKNTGTHREPVTVEWKRKMPSISFSNVTNILMQGESFFNLNVGFTQ